jgi:glycine/D-amino acid oxidase-like deaminating enzyme
MSDSRRIAVVGCGIFGAEVAISAARAGFEVAVYESATRILSGASRNNQNRLHLGFHYPRDIETGRQSIRGFQRFVDTYPECIRGDFPNAYFISDKGSLTTPGAYLEFCDRLGMPYTPIAAADFPVEVRGASSGILCGEVVYDCEVLQGLVAGRLEQSGARVVLGQGVRMVEEVPGGMRLHLQDGSTDVVDAVVNCSYADINRITAQLGHPVLEREYEYTAVPIITLDIPPVGVTVMDGPFMTLLPYGKTSQFLLYNVEHTVIERRVGRGLEESWLDPLTSPFASLDPGVFYRSMIDACSAFVPALADAQMVGCLQGPRMVLARNHATDARPSVVDSYGDRYHTVFSGKIDHCVWVAEEVSSRLVASVATGPASGD